MSSDSFTSKYIGDNATGNNQGLDKQHKAGKIREKSVEHILNAAQQEFVINGFKGTTIQAIADRAALPKANIHYYFKNKENLIHAVLENILDLWDEVLGDIHVDDDPKEVLEHFIRTKVKMSFTHPGPSKLFAMEIIQGAQHLKDYARTYLRKWVREKAKIFELWMEQGKMSKVDPVHLIFLIWSSTQHYADFETQILTIMNRGEYEEEDVEHISHFLCSIIIRGCGIEYP
jgi:TetR/AcrR family transcriptional regulator